MTLKGQIIFGTPLAAKMSPNVSIFVRYSNETDIFGIPMHSEFFFEISASVPAHWADDVQSVPT